MMHRKTWTLSGTSGRSVEPFPRRAERARPNEIGAWKGIEKVGLKLNTRLHKGDVCVCVCGCVLFELPVH